MCSIEGCDAKPVARGLCAKHYMRQRRAGDPMKTGRPGRPKASDTYTMLVRNKGFSFSETSKRTQDRMIRAWRILKACGGQEALEAAILKARRPNGSVNYSLLERLANAAMFRAFRNMNIATE
jgi:hypothetical protein